MKQQVFFPDGAYKEVSTQNVKFIKINNELKTSIIYKNTLKYSADIYVEIEPIYDINFINAQSDVKKPIDYFNLIIIITSLFFIILFIIILIYCITKCKKSNENNILDNQQLYPNINQNDFEQQNQNTPYPQQNNPYQQINTPYHQQNIPYQQQNYPYNYNQPSQTH